MQRHRIFQGLLVVALVVVTAGCGASPSTPVVVIATKTPKPTFTPTVAVAPTQLVIPTATLQPVVAEPTATATATQQPTATPVPEPQFTANQNMNVRQGPGTAYAIVGQLNSGDNGKVSGKNQDGSWLQFNYNGDPAWVAAALVSFSGDPNAVQIAQNIPPVPTARPIPTARPQPPAPPAPTAAPVQRYEYGKALVQSCERQPAGNYINGTVYKNHTRQNGVKVVFSYAPDGSPATQPAISGPHPGYSSWSDGYYSHIVNAVGAKAGTWYVWLVNDAGARISEMARVQFAGPGDGCNQAVVDFDTN
jgi:uncharacterized protein YraI